MIGVRTLSLLAASCFALQLAAVPKVEAAVMTVQYEGIINTFGVSSSPFFRDRPTTSIAGQFSYDSEQAGFPQPSGLQSFVLLDYGFTITFPDRDDYVSTGIVDFGDDGNMTVVGGAGSLLGRGDLFVQGVFEGPDFGLSRPTGSTFQIQDGSSLQNPANVLVENTPPSAPFTLDDVTGGRISLEWTNSLGGRTLAFFNLTSLLVAPAVEPPPTSVPEPGSIALFGFGFLGLLAAARRRSPSSKNPRAPLPR